MAKLDQITRSKFEAKCKNLGMDPDDLPEGTTVEDVLDTTGDVVSQMVRKPGRPTKGTQTIPWSIIDQELVHGISYQRTDGVPGRRYPSPREIANRYGCDASSVRNYIGKMRVVDRRASLLEEEEAIIRQNLVVKSAVERVSLMDKVEDIAHLYADRFIEGLKAPASSLAHIRVDDISQLSKMALMLEGMGGDKSPGGGGKVLILGDIIHLHQESKERRTTTPGGTPLGLIQNNPDEMIDVLDATIIPQSGVKIRTLEDGCPIDPQVEACLDDGDEDPFE